MHTNPNSKGSSEARLTRWSKQHLTIKRNKRYRAGTLKTVFDRGECKVLAGSVSVDGHDRLDSSGMTRSRRYNYCGRR